MSIKNYRFFGKVFLVFFFFTFSFSILVFNFSIPLVHASVVSKPSAYNTNLKSGLVGWWTMDGADVVNGVVLDKSGSNNNGNLINIATTTFYKAGKIGQGFNFNGAASSGTRVKTTSDFINTNTVTVSAWIYAKSYGAIAAGRIIDNGKFFLRVSSSSNRLVLSSDAGTTNPVSANNSISLNTWIHIVAIRTSVTTANTTFYVNSVLSGTANQNSGTPVGGTTNVIIGNANAGDRTFDGIIDDVRIYSRALSATEVRQLYNLGQAKVNETPTTNTNINSGLLGWWTFDGKNSTTSTTADDTSGRGLTATLHDAPFLPKKTPAKIGQGLAFDGVNNYASLASNPLAGVMTAANSTCAWALIKDPNILGAGAWDQTILNFRTDASNGVVMSNDYSSGGDLVASYRLAGIFYGLKSTTVVFKKNTWANVCYVWNGSAVTLYANGTALTGTASTNPIGTANVIGALDDTLSGIWNGTVDDIRVYSRALTATEVRQIYNQGVSKVNISPVRNMNGQGLSAGLVGYWTFDGKDTNWATGVTLDKSSLGNNGQLISMSTTTSPVPGKLGQGLKFDGVNDYVKVTTTSGLPIYAPPNPYSIALWIKAPAGSASSNTIYAEGGSVAGGGNFIFRLFSGSPATKLALQIRNDANDSQLAIVDSATTVFNNKWHHVVWADNNGTAALYVDGVRDSTNYNYTPTGSYTNGLSSIGVLARGSAPSFTNYFQGTLDDLRIYNRALSVDEVKQLYNMGR